jgi:beta-galactosidase
MFYFQINYIPTFAQSQSMILTPDKTINEQIRGKDIKAIDFIKFDPEEMTLKMLPYIQPWNWLAAKNISYENKEFSFIYFNGYIYIDADMKSDCRVRKVTKNVTHLVQSNIFHIAFQNVKGKDSEILILIASEEDKRVSLTLDKSLTGIEKELVYHLKAYDAKLIRIAVQDDKPEWMPMYFEQNKSLRTRYNLNGNWQFKKGDNPEAVSVDFDYKGWQKIDLPHTWNTTDIFDNRNINDGLDIYTSYWRGTAWYRKEIYVEKKHKGERIFIQFEAANQEADVWLNKTFLGRHIGGYTGFQFDITDIMNFDKRNILAVRVDNRYNYEIPPHTADFNMQGGITRDVWLECVNPVHVVSTIVTTPEISRKKATVKIITQLKNEKDMPVEIKLVTNIVDKDGFIAASVRNVIKLNKTSKKVFEQQSNQIRYPLLWSPDEPNLYSVYSHIYEEEMLIDEFKTPLGFRWFEFDAQNGFFLNGEYLKLRGVNLHQDRFGFGHGVPDSLRIKDLDLFKKMGINFIRLAHYPHDPVMLDECDRLGIIVWEEIPYVNTTGREKFIENTRNMMQEMIERDRNHPSIIFWGIGNEMAMKGLVESELQYIRKTLQILNDFSHEIDPARLTIQAHNHVLDFSLVNITDVIGFNRYFGWYGEEIEDFGPVMDEIHSKYPDLRIIISEYGAGAKRGYHVENPQKFDFSEEYQLMFHEGYLKQINNRSWIAGSAAWNGCDFASQAKIGNIPRINQKGLVDYKRIPKDVYYFYQSQWAEDPMVYIVSHTWRNRNSTKREKKQIRVFSNCEHVELFLNGKSQGNNRKNFVWNVKFIQGQNRIVAIGEKMKIIVKDQMDVYYEYTD